MSLPYAIEHPATMKPSTASMSDRHKVIITDAQHQPTAVIERRKPLKNDLMNPIPVEIPATYAVILTKPYGRIEAGDTVYLDMTAPIEGDTVVYRTDGGGLAITRWPADVVPVGVFAGFVHKLQPGDADRWKQEAQGCRQ